MRYCGDIGSQCNYSDLPNEKPVRLGDSNVRSYINCISSLRAEFMLDVIGADAMTSGKPRQRSIESTPKAVADQLGDLFMFLKAKGSPHRT